MAKARLVFNDGVSRTLNAEYPIDVACRFQNWLPGGAKPIGHSAIVLADESIAMFRTSVRYGCSFEVHGIFMGANPATSMLGVATKLKDHLEGGGAVQVITEDAVSATYAACGMMPGVEPQIVMKDKRTWEYMMRLSLINRAAAEMVCNYQAF